jgi:hypothetical protein
VKVAAEEFGRQQAPEADRTGPAHPG